MAKKNRYHHGDLRKALVDAAAALAAEQGSEAVSLRDVARRAHVSHAAPYHHFTGKAELLHAVALEGFRRMDMEMHAAMVRQHKGTPYARLAALGQAYIRFAARHPHYFKAMYRGVTPNKAFLDPDDHSHKNFNLLVRTVQDCLGETGKPGQKTMAKVLAAWATVHGMACLWVERGLCDTPFENKSIESLARSVTETCRVIFETKHRTGSFLFSGFEAPDMLVRNDSTKKQPSNQKRKSRLVVDVGFHRAGNRRVHGTMAYLVLPTSPESPQSFHALRMGVLHDGHGSAPTGRVTGGRDRQFTGVWLGSECRRNLCGGS